MTDSVLLAEVGEFHGSELRSIIRHKGSWVSEVGEDPLELLDGGCGRCRGHFDDIRPFGVGVDDDEKHATIEWTGEVGMYTAPWFFFGRPRVKIVLDRVLGILLTACTSANTIFDVLVDVRPLAVVPGEHLHTADSWMSGMEFLENGSLQTVRNDDAVSKL